MNTQQRTRRADGLLAPCTLDVARRSSNEALWRAIGQYRRQPLRPHMQFIVGADAFRAAHQLGVRR
jgi:hypothetical protein